MNIKRCLLYIFSYLILHTNEILCPIFGKQGYREKLNLYKSQYENGKKEQKSSNKLAQESFNKSKAELLLLKTAVNELAISTPAIEFFKSKNFLPTSINIKNKEVVRSTFLKILEDKEKELNELIKSTGDKPGEKIDKEFSEIKFLHSLIHDPLEGYGAGALNMETAFALSPDPSFLIKVIPDGFAEELAKSLNLTATDLTAKDKLLKAIIEKKINLTFNLAIWKKPGELSEWPPDRNYRLIFKSFLNGNPDIQDFGVGFFEPNVAELSKIRRLNEKIEIKSREFVNYLSVKIIPVRTIASFWTALLANKNVLVTFDVIIDRDQKIELKIYNAYRKFLKDRNLNPVLTEINMAINSLNNEANILEKSHLPLNKEKAKNLKDDAIALKDILIILKNIFGITTIEEGKDDKKPDDDIWG